MEQHRRSVAMLGTGAWALRREEAMDVLGRLVELLTEKRRESPGLHT